MKESKTNTSLDALAEMNRMHTRLVIKRGLPVTSKISTQIRLQIKGRCTELGEAFKLMRNKFLNNELQEKEYLAYLLYYKHVIDNCDIVHRKLICQEEIVEELKTLQSKAAA